MTEQQYAEARNRVIAAALHVCAAEHGGVDSKNDDAEFSRANDRLDTALDEFRALFDE